MTRARTWQDLVLVAFAVALAGWGIHGLLQRDASQTSRTAQAVAQNGETLAPRGTGALENGSDFRPAALTLDSAPRYLPPSGFEPEFRDPLGLDPDYALFLEELEAREAAEDEQAELDGEPAFRPELSEAELDAIDDAELARELATYDTYLAGLADHGVTQ